MMNDCTILVNSCDRYYETWKPFFELFKIQWNECPYRIVLNTETKSYRDPEIVVETINSPTEKTWSSRLKNVLNHIDTEYVMFFLDDEFLGSPVNTNEFENALTYMRNHQDVGYILLRHSEKQNKHESRRYFARSELTEKYQLVCLSALYRRDFLIKILRNHESPWEFERYATRRLKKYHYQVLQYSSDYPVIFEYYDRSIGVCRGKWLPQTKAFLEGYGIEVNYDNLGWYTEPQPLDTETKVTMKSILHYINEKAREIRSLL